MNAALYDVVEVNVHSSDDFSLISASEAATLTKAGLIVTLDGCGVTGMAQPGSPNTVDDPWTSPAENIAVSYLYGSSKALAAMGDPHWRGHYAHAPTVYQELKNNSGYLGKGHLLRMKKQFALSGSDAFLLKENAGEMLLGDPFMDLGWLENFSNGTTRWTFTGGGTWGVVSDGTNKVLQQTNNAVTVRALTGESTWTNQKVQARVKPISYNGSDKVISLHGRFVDDSNFYQLVLTNANRVEIKKKVGGVVTVLSSVAFTVTPGTWYTLKFELVGTQLKGYVNGSLKVSATDSAFSSGRAGLNTYNATAAFDDVTITP
jgi:hypothetical protein